MNNTKNPALAKGMATLIQAIIVMIGVGVFAFMLVEPHFEGRNANATLFEIYFKDPFLAYAYAASVFFFVALWNARKVAAYAGDDMLFSQAAAKSLRTIKNCARTVVAFIVGAEAWLFIAMRGKDDIAGGVFMGLLAIVVAGTIAIVATRLERAAQSAARFKSESA